MHKRVGSKNAIDPFHSTNSLAEFVFLDWHIFELEESIACLLRGISSSFLLCFLLFARVLHGMHACESSFFFFHVSIYGCTACFGSEIDQSRLPGLWTSILKAACRQKNVGLGGHGDSLRAWCYVGWKCPPGHFVFFLDRCFEPLFDLVALWGRKQIDAASQEWFTRMGSHSYPVFPCPAQQKHVVG